MKHLITTIAVFFILTGFSQNDATLIPALTKKERVYVLKTKPVCCDKNLLTAKSILVDEYTVTNFNVLKRNAPHSTELKALTGSIVKIGPGTFTGNEIDPFTFDFDGIENMTRSEFIETVFGREIRAPEPNLPDQIRVHKTNNSQLFGFVEIDENHLAVPYKGVLLFLERN